MKLAVMDSTRFAARTGVHATFARDHEYKRHGTVVSLLAGIELLTGKVHASETATAVESLRIPQALDAAYPASTTIKLILDNHSAHISKETRSWLATRPTGRFEFTFTPIHGSLSHRGLLLQVCPLGLASHPGGIQTGAGSAS